MTDWELRGVYFKSCNCAYGCPCDFWAAPTNGACEGMSGMDVAGGHYRGGDLEVDLGGIRWVTAFRWPGPLHEGNGTVKAYFDPAIGDDQLRAMKRILSGRAGGGWFGLMAEIVSDVRQPELLPIVFEVEGRNGRIRIGEELETVFAPLRNPVNGAEHVASIVIPDGLEYPPQGAEVVDTPVLRSRGEVAFDHSGCHTSLVERQVFSSLR